MKKMPQSFARHLPFPLSHLPGAAHDALPLISRTFHLFEGEQIKLARIAGDDFIYVLSGEVEVTTPTGVSQILHGDTSGHTPYPMPEDTDFITFRAIQESTLHHVDYAKLDYLLFWNEMLENISPVEIELKRRFKLVINSLAFRSIPAHCLLDAIKKMQPISLAKGTEIVQCRKPCDGFYLIDSGFAEVWREDDETGDQLHVRDLRSGDTFGELAMVTGKESDITVRFKDEASLLMLSKEDFQSLICEKMIKEVDAALAKSMLASGYTLLDVRLDYEYDEDRIPNAIHIPLQQLQERYNELDASKSYVVYCHSGNRSAVATLLLKERDIDAVSLKGGLREWPYEIDNGQLEAA
jgi:rhodanese-related sulfurtransferase